MISQPGPNRFLRTLCETRWYSLILVCLGVENFEAGFQYCLQLSGGEGNIRLPGDVKTIIRSRLHFAKNSQLTQILKPIIDSIGRLEGRDATLGDILAEFCYIRSAWMRLPPLDSEDANDFKAHALRILSERAKPFNEEVYIVAFYLSPRYKRVAISRKWDFRTIWNSILNIVKVWGLTINDVQKLRAEISQYQNDDGPFLNANGLPKDPRTFWNLIVDVPTLRRFALKLFAIVPHGAAVERLFSTLSLAKSKIRNRLSVDSLKQIAMLRADLKKDSIRPTVVSRLSTFTMGNEIENNIDAVFEEYQVIDDDDQELLEENIREWELNDEYEAELQNAEPDILDEFFDFDLYEEEMGFINIPGDNGGIDRNLNLNEDRDPTQWAVEDFMM